ncbi:hypothetical protein HY469_04555 [Candidatus Roizmanbacteria bacterium]|nr:hypothetical protein [Candidatus Roizmanbacteria bacterium]
MQDSTVFSSLITIDGIDSKFHLILAHLRMAEHYCKDLVGEEYIGPEIPADITRLAQRVHEAFATSNQEKNTGYWEEQTETWRKAHES